MSPQNVPPPFSEQELLLINDYLKESVARAVTEATDRMLRHMATVTAEYIHEEILKAFAEHRAQDHQRPVSTFALWGDISWTPGDWGLMVGMLAQSAHDTHGRDATVKAAWDALMDEVAAHDTALAGRIENALYDVVWDCTRFAAIFGVGLAKTWPRGPEELDSWAERALTFTESQWPESGEHA